MTAETVVPIFVMANDTVLPELVRLLASIRKHSASIPVNVVPFNSDVELCKRAADIFGCQFYNDDLSELDALGREIYDSDPPQEPYPYMLGKIRKLCIFRICGPAVYIDVDTILVSPLFEIISKANQAAFDIGFVSPSKGWIYEEVEEAKALLQITKGFSSGFLYKKTNHLDVSLIRNTILSHFELYHRVRKRGVVDQPLLNFVVDLNGLTALSLPDALGLSAHTVATSDSISFQVRLTSAGEVIQTWQGAEKQVLFLHAVGKYKHNGEYDYLFHSSLYNGIVSAYRKDREFGIKLLDSIDSWRPRDSD